MTTDARQKKLLALEFQHKNICNIDTASTGHVNFLTPFLEDARLRIFRDSPECKPKTDMAP